MLKRSGDGSGDNPAAESKPDGLATKLFAGQNGLSSCQNDVVCTSLAGEKNPDDIGGRVPGAGDKIPGN